MRRTWRVNKMEYAGTAGLVQACREAKVGQRFSGPLAVPESEGLTLPAELLAQAGLGADDGW
jgi:hypothetical protein